MLTDMERKQEQALKVLRQQVLEATLDMEREEAAEFFGELADWAYAQQAVSYTHLTLPTIS